MTPPTTPQCVLAIAASFALTLDLASAQTPIGGNVSGTLSAGVYHSTGNLTVPLSQTWTLNPGVIVKFGTGHQMIVNGALIANGTSLNPVIFTDDADDSAGGDTNGNGPSVGGPASWSGIIFNSTSDASALAFAEVRFGGSNFISNIELNDADITMSNCAIRNCFVHGMDLNANSNPTVTNCTFTGNSGHAIDNCHISAVPGFTNNTASGNNVNSLRVTSGVLGSNVTINAASNLTGGILIGNALNVAAGTTLALNAGVILKFTGGTPLTVNGVLQVNGTSGSPVVFTDDADDSAGGDTNSNGASAGGAAAWQGIVFNATSDASSLTHASVRFGGSNFFSNIELNSADVTLSNCTIRDCFVHGMDLNANSNPTVTNCTFTGNNGHAIDNCHISAVPGFTNNTATGNNVNSLRVTSGVLGSNVTINAASNLTGGILIGNALSVASGTTLALNAGVILKFTGGSPFTVDGVLQANGTSGSPVIFTEDADDSAGGDTNSNGASAGGAAAWQGITFNPTSDASSLTHASVRFGGSNFVSNIELNSADVTLSNCTIRDCFVHGMDLNASSIPTVTDCTFTSNAGPAVHNAQLAAVPGFTNNTASGNGGNYIQVTDGTLTSAVTLGARSIMNGALRVSTGIAVQSVGTLTVHQGVVFKFDGGHEVVVNGAVDLRGTAYEPVVFTAFADDTWGGDTNGNGASVGGPAAWRGITINAGALTSSLENVLIRYPGSGFVDGLISSSPNVTLRSVRIDDAFDDGFVLSALAANPTNLVAWSCGVQGIRLSGGAFALVHATVAGNGTGIRAEAGWTGTVINSISHGNTTNFSNFGAGGQVSFSNGGFAGSNGNINADPLFVNLGAGDLHLLPGSPSINAAELLSAFAAIKDHDEYPRILDSDLSGTIGADMGAHEHAVWDMNVTGTSRIGTTVTFTVAGPPGDTIYALGFLDGILPLPPFGIILAGTIPYVTLIPLTLTSLPTGTPFPILVPNDPMIVDAVGAIQALTAPAGNPAVGNLTQLFRFRVRP